MLRPWQILASQAVLTERWYRVVRETVAVRPGKVVDDYYLGVFPDIVLVVALTADGDVLLVRQYKHGAGKILTELPAGFMEDGEEALSCAQRELREETGFTAVDWRLLGTFYSNPTKVRGGRVHVFLAQGAQQAGELQLDELEDIEVLRQPFIDMTVQARRGDLPTTSACLALLLAEAALIKPPAAL